MQNEVREGEIETRMIKRLKGQLGRAGQVPRAKRPYVRDSVGETYNWKRNYSSLFVLRYIYKYTPSSDMTGRAKIEVQ